MKALDGCNCCSCQANRFNEGKPAHSPTVFAGEVYDLRAEVQRLTDVLSEVRNKTIVWPRGSSTGRLIEIHKIASDGLKVGVAQKKEAE